MHFTIRLQVLMAFVICPKFKDTLYINVKTIIIIALYSYSYLYIYIHYSSHSFSVFVRHLDLHINNTAKCINRVQHFYNNKTYFAKYALCCTALVMEMHNFQSIITLLVLILFCCSPSRHLVTFLSHLLASHSSEVSGQTG